MSSVSRTADASPRNGASSNGGAASVSDQDVHIWRITLRADDESYRDLLATLSHSERDRAARYHFDIDRRRFVIARARLRQILGRYLGMGAADVAFEYGAHGKPSVATGASDAGVRFNLSHTADIALCAVAQRAEVGVDIEQVRRDTDVQLIGTQFFSPDEQQLLAESSDHHETFARIWVRKEAYVKATGYGIGADLQAFTVSLAERSEVRDATRSDRGTWTVREIATPNGYAAAVVSSEPLNVIDFWL